MAWYALGVFAAIMLGLACLAHGLTRDRSDLLGAALVLALTWPLTMVVSQVCTPPQSMLLGPVLDLGLASALALAARARWEVWKMYLLWILGFQSFTHVAYQAASDAPWALLIYIIELNITYGLMLAIVAGIGGRDVVLYIHRHGLGPGRARPRAAGLE
jgi:hypothetical protein